MKPLLSGQFTQLSKCRISTATSGCSAARRTPNLLAALQRVLAPRCVRVTFRHRLIVSYTLLCAPNVAVFVLVSFSFSHTKVVFFIRFCFQALCAHFASLPVHLNCGFPLRPSHLSIRRSSRAKLQSLRTERQRELAPPAASSLSSAFLSLGNMHTCCPLD